MADGATTLNGGGGGVESGGKQVRIVRSGHEPSGRVVGDTVCKNKYSSYCVADVEPRGSLGGGKGACTYDVCSGRGYPKIRCSKGGCLNLVL